MTDPLVKVGICWGDVVWWPKERGKFVVRLLEAFLNFKTKILTLRAYATVAGDEIDSFDLKKKKKKRPREKY